MTGLTRTISAPKKIGPTSNYRVAPWFISTSSVDQIMQFTYLPWVVEIPNLEGILNHLMSRKDHAPSKIHPVF